MDVKNSEIFSLCPCFLKAQSDKAHSFCPILSFETKHTSPMLYMLHSLCVKCSCVFVIYGSMTCAIRCQLRCRLVKVSQRENITVVTSSLHFLCFKFLFLVCKAQNALATLHSPSCFSLDTSTHLHIFLL